MPAKSKKDGGQRYDWEKIKVYYVTTPGSSLKKTAQKFGIRFATVTKKSAEGNWVEAKKEYHKGLTNELIDKVRTIRADNLAKEVVAADAIADIITKMLEDPQQFYRHLVTEGSENYYGVEERIYDKLDTRALRDVTAVLKSVEELKRSIVNLQKIEPLQKHQLDMERLQLERERFEFEKEKANMYRPDKGNSIVIEGMEKEWSE